MAFTYLIDPGRRLAHVTVTGTATGAELAETTRTVSRRWSPDATRQPFITASISPLM